MGKASILIAEDDESLRQVLSDIVELKGGYSIDTAGTGQESLAKARERFFHVALLDLKLPDMEGVVLLKKLREIHQAMEGIILTAYASVETAAAAMSEGAFAYLVKPSSPDELIVTIERALEKQRLVFEKKEEMEQLQMEASLYKALAEEDSLTGVYNRFYFGERLHHEIGRARRYECSLSLLMIDIDGFKRYNDMYGHLEGDEALRRVSQTLKRECRDVDTVARYGGDEFVILMPETDKEQAIRVAQRLRRAVEKIEAEKTEVPPVGTLTLSIGVATYTMDADGARLVSKADKALYAAKRSRNAVYAWDTGEGVSLPCEG